jgi:formylglycine-generating enzyme required for sulfatase activity
MLAPGALSAQPIPLRQPFVFYLGHLPAFAWNQIVRGALGEPPLRADFETLFERGIDPVGVDAYTPAASWPDTQEIVDYRDRVRGLLASALARVPDPSLGWLVLEHELMHHETLLYMIQQLPYDQKIRPPGWTADRPEPVGPRGPRIRIPAGTATLGAREGALPFGWDNEFPETRVDVRAFEIDVHPVRNRDYVEFLDAAGKAGRLRAWRGLFEERPLEEVADAPVYVSWEQADAYARFRGARLPTEAEFHRAAYGAPEGGELPRLPRGAPSAWGVCSLVGGGWEWTSSLFAPFPGFRPCLPTYPGYSQDFFDGHHYVLKGASWATDDLLLRRSFRNWYQPRYPYVFAKFRCVSP